MAASGWIVGYLAGPVLGLLFTLARIGPEGLIWWEGKGGQTDLAPLGQTICTVLSVVGAIGGTLWGWAFDARNQPRIAAAKRKSHAWQEYLWDRELDG
jgi:hypothetical protein